MKMENNDALRGRHRKSGKQLCRLCSGFTRLCGDWANFGGDRTGNTRGHRVSHTRTARRRPADSRALQQSQLCGCCGIAGEFVMTYKVRLQKSEEGYSVSCPGLPGCWSQDEN